MFDYCIRKCIFINKMESHRKVVFFYQSLLVFLLVFTIYLLTAPKTVVLEDDGLFILASYFNGIAHSPGYPLFTILGHIATYIPIGSVAYRVHALSGLFGALSCVCLYFIALILFKDRVLACTSAICLGISKIFWSQSIIAEVYTFNAFIFLSLLLTSLYIVRFERLSSSKFILLIFFIYGLGLSNHWPLLILSTPALVVILWFRKKEVFQNFLPGFFLLLLGLLPYVWMVIRSQMDPVISFYGPIDSLKEFWFMVSREGYAEQDSSIGAGYFDKIQFCFYAIKETLIQFGYLGGVLGLIGFVRQWKCWEKNICFGLVLAYLGSTIVLAILLGFSFDLLHRNLFKVYPLISYAVFGIWLVLGIKETTLFIKNKLGLSPSIQFIKIVFCFLVFITGLFGNLPYNYRANDVLGQNYALTILGSLKENAVFITGSDVDSGTLGYFNLIENVRSDVTLYNIVSLLFNTRLENPMNISNASNFETLSNFIHSQDRPIYYVAGIPRIYGGKDFGIYLEVDKSLEPGLTSFIFKPKVSIFIEGLLQIEKLYDPWESMVHKSIISDYCRVYMNIRYSGDQVINVEDIENIRRVCKGYLALLTAANTLIRRSTPDFDLINSFLEEAKLLQNEAKDLEDIVHYDIVYAKLLIKQDNYSKALEVLHGAVAALPKPDNEAYALIDTIKNNQKGH